MPITELGDFSVSYLGDEATEIMLEPVFFDDDFRAGFKIMPNVTTRRKMQFAEKLENIVRKKTGCGFRPVGGLRFYDRYVEVENMKVNLSLCWDEFEDTVFEELLNKGTRITDLTGTILESILLERVRQAMRLDIDRIYHFGDESSNDPNYDQMDGLWTVRYPALVAANLVPWLNIGTGALGAGNYITAIRSVYDNAPNELKALPTSMKVFNVSGNFYLGLMEDYENAGGGDGGMLRMIEGSQGLTFRGIPVVPRWRWDDIDTALGNANFNRVEYTTPMNKVLAYDGVTPGSDLMAWYEPKEEELYVKANFKMGGNYVHHDLISLGY